MSASVAAGITLGSLQAISMIAAEIIKANKKTGLIFAVSIHIRQNGINLLILRESH